MPQGGSVTLGSMIPLIIFAIAYGPIVGIFAGIAFGLVRLMYDPFVVHWIQLLLDYPLAFGAIGLAGIFKNSYTKATIIAFAGRFLMAFISGVVFFGDMAEGTHPIIYSMAYNGTYILVELIIALILINTPQAKSIISQIKK